MALGRPCGACRFLKKKCLENCVFVPHFSGDETAVDQFRSIHKVFGHSNFAKVLKQLPVEHRHHVVASMLYEAQARLRDPVHGCVSEIQTLQQQIESLKEQLALTSVDGRISDIQTLQQENASLKEQLALTRNHVCIYDIQTQQQNESLKEQLALTRAQLAECLSLLEGYRNIQLADHTNDNQSNLPSSMPCRSHKIVQQNQHLQSSMPSRSHKILQQNQHFLALGDHQSAMAQSVAINSYAMHPVAAAEGPSRFPMDMHKVGVSNNISNLSSVHAGIEGPSGFPMDMQKVGVRNNISNLSSVQQRDAGIDFGVFHSAWTSGQTKQSEPNFIIHPRGEDMSAKLYSP